MSEYRPQTAIPLGDLLSGARPRRNSNEQITVYKAMGIAMEDMVAANIAYRNKYQCWCQSRFVTSAVKRPHGKSKTR